MSADSRPGPHLLLGDEGAAAMCAASAEADPDSLSAASRLRSRFGPELAAATLAQTSLRRRAQAKFGAEAAQIWFTTDGLEQASRPEVAAWRAARLAAAGVRRVIDFGCGIGADARAFLAAGMTVTAVELDPQTAALAAANLPGAEVLVGDATQLAPGLLAAADATTAVFVDPARRTDRGRSWRVADFNPAWPFVLELRCNAQPAGFGTNHNRALAGAHEAFVCVLNPDVALLPDGADPFASLVQAAGMRGVGCAYPLQVDVQGRVQDSERALPTLVALWQRRVRRRGEQRLDWVNGACLVLPSPVWVALGGFDEGYHMYCEDVDLCLRLRLAGWGLVGATAVVVHAGDRASRRAWRPLWWHVRSLLRLRASPVFWRARGLPSLQGAVRPE